jgi:hypothetical protein
MSPSRDQGDLAELDPTDNRSSWHRFHLLSERVVSDGKLHTIQGVAETIEAAFTKAQSKMPNNAAVLEKKVLTAPEQKVVTVEALHVLIPCRNLFWLRSNFGFVGLPFFFSQS